MRFKLRSMVAVGIAFLAFSACGSGGGGRGSNVKQGQFLDSAVEG